MKNINEKIARTFGESCHNNNVVGLCITMNEKNNTNAIGLNATAREAGFMIRELVRRISMEFSNDEVEFEAFCEELAKSLNLPKKRIVH